MSKQQPPIETLEAVARILDDHNAVAVIDALAAAASMCAQGTSGHPDIPGTATLKFSHVQMLFEQAAEMLANAEREACPHGPFKLAGGAGIVADMYATEPPPMPPIEDPS